MTARKLSLVRQILDEEDKIWNELVAHGYPIIQAKKKATEAVKEKFGKFDNIESEFIWLKKEED